MTEASDGSHPRKVYPSMRARCRNCDPHAFEGRTADQILWATDGTARCPDCGQHLDAQVGGWTKPLRWRCQACGDPLKGRQTTWCSRWWKGWAKVCSIAWGNPSLLADALAEAQDGLCGVCLLPLSDPEAEPYMNRVEVDHVVPLAAGGERLLANLRAAHACCNQSKKARTLTEARISMGMDDAEVSRRLAGISPEALELLQGAPLDPHIMQSALSFDEDAARELVRGPTGR